ncbi:MAG: ankyrin repeat domain-containing protein [Verrucomicrobiota bacterium]
MAKQNDGSFSSPGSIRQSLAVKYCRSGDQRRLEILLNLGPKLNAIRDNEGSTLLTIAAQNRHIEIAKDLIRRGAEVNSANRRGYTPLSYATYNGDVFMTLLLIQCGADTEANLGGGLTAYLLARMFHQERVATILLASGADPNAKTDQGDTATTLAHLMD